MKRKFFLMFVLAALAALALSQPASAQWRSWGYGYGGYSGYPSGGYYGYGGYGYGGYGYGGWSGWGHIYRAGIKLDLDRLSKSEKELVLGGYLFVDGNDEGVVDQYDGFWNGILPLPPGPHSISIAYLKEDQWYRFDTDVSVRLGRITNIYPRFRKVESLTASAPQSQPPPQAAPPSPPAPATPTPPAQPTSARGGYAGYPSGGYDRH